MMSCDFKKKINLPFITFCHFALEPPSNMTSQTSSPLPQAACRPSVACRDKFQCTGI